MVRTRDNRTYRLSNIPYELDKSGLVSLLTGLEQNGFGSAGNICVCSLAPSLIEGEPPRVTRTKIATIMFKKVPACLDGDGTQWVIRIRHLDHHKSCRDMIFDTDFGGFTPLNSVDTSLHSFDCITISGLASHPFGSWKKRDTTNEDSNFMWLRDQLPEDIPGMRVLTYGYDTKLVNSNSFQDMSDLTRSFLSNFELISHNFDQRRPIILLAHSMGGILLKSALIWMHESEDRGASKALLGLIRQVILFGVPNRGMDESIFRGMAAGQPNANFVAKMNTGSPYLARLDRDFFEVVRQYPIRLISVYESVGSPKRKETSPGVWIPSKVPNDLVVYVDRRSAIQEGTADKDIIHMAVDHSTLVKFDEGSKDYRVLLGKLREVKPITSKVPYRPTTRRQWYSDPDDVNGPNGLVAQKPACTIM